MNGTLLIIDDSQAIRSQVAEILAGGTLFRNILQAADGVEGFKLLVNNDIDLILCDIEMPGIDGLKFLSMLQSRQDLKEKPVIMLTSHDDLELKVRGLESGASDYITKPFEPTELVARLRVHMQIKVLRDELQRSNKLLMELSQTDPLTRLGNRRHLFDRLKVELCRCQRSGQPIALIMADIDHFKRVNDHYGHQAGDQILQRIAELLQEQLRSYDTATRFGGEEFCLVLPETSLEEAQDIAERVLLLGDRPDLRLQHLEGKLTLSIGIAAFDGKKAVSADELVQLAGMALAEAKQAGRNQVRTSSSLEIH
jgi:two-component system, cell cycle response regulator